MQKGSGFNKDSIKESLGIEQVFDLVEELGGEPHIMNGSFVAKTICHNGIGEGSHKLYYYENTKLFKCYTECNDDAFDIFQLVMKVKKCTLFQSIAYVANFFGFAVNFVETNENELKDWKIFEHYDKAKSIDISEPIVQFKYFDDSILQNLPSPRIIPWEQEEISNEVIQSHYIKYDPSNMGIVIPHYDINGKLIGIRERTLVLDEEQYGKYRPAIFNKQMYNHPLGFNLYNLNNTKDTIKAFKKVILFESEKSCLKYASYFGEENDISVAVCGSSLISHQFKLLKELGVEEIIIAFDKQFKEINDDEWKKWTKKLTDINTKYGGYCLISYMFDKENLLAYKSAPIDHGKDIFLKMFKERIVI